MEAGQRRRLLQHVGAGQIVAAAAQDFAHRDRLAVAGIGDGVVGIDIGQIFRAQRLERHRVLILFPAPGSGLLGIADRDDVRGVLEAGGVEDRAAGRSRRQQLQRLPAELGHLADRLRRRLAGGDVVENVRARLREIDELRIDRRIGQIVGLLHDHLGGAAGIRQHLLEGPEEIAAEIVVLVEDADLRIRLHAHDVLGENPRFGRIQRQARHGPFVVLRIVPFRRAGVEQQLRHALGIEIFVHGGLRRGAERAEQRQHLLLLDQPPRRLDAFRRAVGVVQGQEGDLAPVDAALSLSIWK